MELIKTAAVFAVTGITIVVFIPVGICAFLISLFGLKKPMSMILYKIAQMWARGIIKLTGCRMIVEGTENIPKQDGFCFVANHVGIFDIILALAYAGRPFGFIAKKELLYIPGLNVWILLLGGLFIDRKQPRKALATINRGIKHIKSGGGMLIFPEGTRSRGQGLGPFLPGALKLATQSGAITVPVAITGSYEVFEKNYRVNAVPVYLSFLPPLRISELPPEDRKQILAGRIHDRIAEVLEKHKSGMA
ncbi:MAG: 1-acyl-sn-glycerol-3-phosphate acyltransferase [Treponema sp.]|nr:1-acyl-sn-glycerol-3-phosphate acyltransferase [Treponema sp.]